MKAGCQVRVLDRAAAPHREWPAAAQVIEGDIRDAGPVKSAAAGVDTVFHLAGRSHALSELQEDEAAYRSINVEGTHNILEGALAGGARCVVFFSSVKVMGEETSGCLDETAQPTPATAYGRSKLEAEELVREYASKTDLRGVCLRLPLVYGPGNKGNIYRMISAIDRHRFPPFPDIPNHRSLVHVANIVDAAMLAATSMMPSQCYIVTDARSYSTRELYELICLALGRRIPQWHVPVGVLRLLGNLGDVIGRLHRRRFLIDSQSINKLTGSAWYSCQRITRELGYQPKVTFEAALPELIAQYRNERRKRPTPWVREGGPAGRGPLPR